ncbi:MAG: right-handed parallel beta-helix repeat-containing protein [Janthinobacterium lividum]
MNKKSFQFKRIFLFLLLLGAVAVALAMYGMERFGVAPRTLAPYIEKRTSGHNPTIVQTGKFVSNLLMGLDRGVLVPINLIPKVVIGVQAQPTAPQTVAKVASDTASAIMVSSAEQARTAIGNAKAGDVITFLPGTYRFTGTQVKAQQPGTSLQPIVVRASVPGSVTLEFEMVEGFTVSAPYWRFENLVIRGVCSGDSDCEHAFHVVGNAHHFTARNNVIENVNAHFKINGQSGAMPDHGLLESNTLRNTRVRDTANPVVPIDLVAASGWMIRHNLIHDFIKGDGNRVSYGGFVKGAGSDNHFRQNMVLCEFLLLGAPGQRVGLSLGGGGSGGEFCRDKQCKVEQQDSSIEANLISGCSDAGIYLNRAAGSRINQNTLIDTAGIDVRFAESDADLEGNLVDGPIRHRDGATVRTLDNLDGSLTAMYLGWHPLRQLFADAGQLDLQWRTPPKRRQNISLAPLDLCSAKRLVPSLYGAFEDFSACLAR